MVFIILLDGIPQDEEQIHISLPLFILYTIIAIIGIALAIICFILNLWFRKQKYVINYSAIMHIIIFLILQISETYQSLCQHYDHCWCCVVLFDSDFIRDR